MIKKTRIFLALLSGMLFCVATLAQKPVVDIDQSRHPNLYDAQRHVVAASEAVVRAQNDNKDDLGGHAEKARQLLVQANQELKAAAAAANAAAQKKK
jgi:hypothetical protein